MVRDDTNAWDDDDGGEGDEVATAAATARTESERNSALLPRSPLLRLLTLRADSRLLPPAPQPPLWWLSR